MQQFINCNSNLSQEESSPWITNGPYSDSFFAGSHNPFSLRWVLFSARHDGHSGRHRHCSSISISPLGAVCRLWIGRRHQLFPSESERSAGGRGGTLSDSNQRSGKGFRYTFALAKTYGGLVGEYKLDWFFVKGLATDSRKPGGKYQFAPHFAWTLWELNNAPQESLSDHAPITVDLPLTEPPPRATNP